MHISVYVYLIIQVTMVVLASGIYSVPSSVCNTEHIKTVFQEFNTIPMNKVEVSNIVISEELSYSHVMHQSELLIDRGSIVFIVTCQYFVTVVHKL